MRKMSFSFVAVLLLALGGACSSSPSDSESTDGSSAMFRASAARDGVYQHAEPLAGEQVWAFTTDGPVRSTPAVVDGVVYVGSDDGRLYALDAEDGAEKWRFETGGAVSSSPQVADGVVYFTSEDGTVYAVAADDGALRWERTTAEPRKFGIRDWNYFSASPLVHDGVVYVGSRGSEAQFFALDAADGAVKWSIETGRKGVRTAPALVDGVLYVTSADGFALALDPADGSETWSHRLAADIRSTPAVVDGVVYFGSRTAKTHALDAKTGEPRWDLPEGNGSWVESSPAVSDGTVYGGGSDSHDFHAIDAATGEVTWTAPLETNIFTSPAVAGDTVYIATGDAYLAQTEGSLYALDRATGEQQWSFLALNFFSSPVIADGTLFIGNDDGTVYALR